MSLLPFVTDHHEAGCDEAGRGCLAGPVVAASVILPKDFKNKWLNDSKKLNEKRRNELRIIVESEAVSWGVGFVGPEEIDKINILQASFLAMHRAIDKLLENGGAHKDELWRHITLKCRGVLLQHHF